MDKKMQRLLALMLGGLLLLVAATGIAGIVIFGRVRAGESEQRTRLLAAANWLRGLENGIYLSGSLARDYFADPGGPEADGLASRLAQLEGDTRRATSESSAELRGEVDTYWRMLRLMMEVARKRTTPGLDAYFRRQLAERRANTLRIAQQAKSAMDAVWKQDELRIAAVYERLRWILIAELVLVLAAAGFLSFVAARRLLRLERERALLATQLEGAQEEERRAIARELHDEIGQSVSGMVLDIGRAAASASGEVRPHLAAAVEAGERTVEAIRRIALSLRPSMLDDLGLVAALEWQAREVGNRTGLHVAVDAEDSAGNLPDPHRTCIYRIAQEALHNCARHAHANEARLALTRGSQTITLRVEDNGRGFHPNRTRGLGILGMEERAARLGGKLRLKSEPGKGTELSVELPV